ncbi:MAG: hypothetical protein SAJ12_20500 [Jaaginema sp. PMC 1079.18]|nr:hypothetical protein [Jaaginema sp. PMC 1080.18]MEC4853369.1 hypothetical protein [Jaaginema sp. PMC 1079.18]MEC4866404.1 hypothetical protein [Jaaginema sp. PMC 1078.18]
MIFSRSVGSAIAGTTALLSLAVAPTSATVAPEALTATARNLTVTLAGCGTGLGLLIDRQEDYYSLLVPTTQIHSPDKACWVELPDGDKQTLQNAATAHQMVGFDLTILKFKSDRDYQIANFTETVFPEGGATIYLVGEDTSDASKLSLTPVTVKETSQQANSLQYQTPTVSGVRLGSGLVLDSNNQVIGLQISDRESIVISPSLAILLNSPTVQVASAPGTEDWQQPTQTTTPSLAKPPAKSPRMPFYGINTALEEATSQKLTSEEKVALSQHIILSREKSDAQTGFPVIPLLVGVGVCGAIALLYRL